MGNDVLGADDVGTVVGMGLVGFSVGIDVEGVGVVGNLVGDLVGELGAVVVLKLGKKVGIEFGQTFF